MAERQQGNLYKRGNSWYVAITINGEVIRRSAGPDRAIAEVILAELRKQAAIAKAVGQGWPGLEELKQNMTKAKITFAEVAEDYFEREKAAWKKSTVYTYRDILNVHLIPWFGKKRVREITRSDVVEFRNSLIDKVSATRINRIMTMLRSLLSICVTDEIIDKNPADGIKKLQQKKPDVDPLPLHELNLALANIDPHFRPLFTCLAWTGARPNEMIALRWTDIDFDRKEIKISKGRVRGVEALPKTASSQRIIPMLPPVEQALEELRQRHLTSISGHIFVTKAGNPINKHLDEIWARGLKKAGLRHRPSYQLRHTFASICIQQGIAPGWVAMVLGHSSMEMTFTRYARYIPEPQAEHERKLAHLFTHPPPAVAVEGGYCTKKYTGDDPAPITGSGTPIIVRKKVRKRRKDGQTRGLEPPSAGTTIQCLNHLATPAMAIPEHRVLIGNLYISMMGA